MGKNQVHAVVVDRAGGPLPWERVNAFHVELIRQRLARSLLTVEQKGAVIDRILEDLRSREVDGIIR